MKIYSLKATQNIPVDLKTAWDFISNPENLNKITPPDMGFEIKTENLPKEMYPGMLITYTVKPLFGIPVTWVTEITQMKEQNYFIDNQVIGPYKLWHHQHFLKEIDGGVQMDDEINYALPFGILGEIVQPIIVANKLKKIFDFRKIAIEKMFGKL